MKFCNPKDFSKLKKIINPDEFINYMFQKGDLQKITGDYNRDCRLLCHSACAWIILKLTNTIYEFDIEVLYGNYRSFEHSWIKIGDYYLDLTLAQFEEDAPKLAITSSLEKSDYDISETYSKDEWIMNKLPEFI